MTREEKIKMFAMRVDGCTLQQIGDEFGITRECVRQILAYASRGNGKTRHKTYKYPAIETFLIDNRLTAKKMAESIGVCYVTFANVMTGKRDPSKETIDKILAFTGLAYEEAFKER